MAAEGSRSFEMEQGVEVLVDEEEVCLRLVGSRRAGN